MEFYISLKQIERVLILIFTAFLTLSTLLWMKPEKNYYTLVYNLWIILTIIKYLYTFDWDSDIPLFEPASIIFLTVDLLMALSLNNWFLTLAIYIPQWLQTNALKCPLFFIYRYFFFWWHKIYLTADIYIIFYKIKLKINF